MKEKSQKRKNDILRATLELVAEQGFHGTSISQIAKKANVNVGLIYYYFENKDDILTALYIDCKTRLSEHAFQNCSQNLSVDIVLKQIVKNIINYFMDNRLELPFIEQFDNSPYLGLVIESNEYLETMKPYSVMYDNLIKQDLIKKLPVEIFQNLLMGAIISLTKYYLNQSKIDDEATLDTAVKAIWDMVKL